MTRRLRFVLFYALLIAVALIAVLLVSYFVTDLHVANRPSQPGLGRATDSQLADQPYGRTQL